MLLLDKSKKEYKELICFIKSNFPEAKSALLTGSYGTKKAKDNSDIDIIIFSDSISEAFVEKTEINSQKYDIIYLSTHYNYLIQSFYLDINARIGVYLHMITSSRILFDNDDFLTELILFSKKNILKEYGNINTKEIEYQRKIISNALEDLDDINSFGEFYFTTYLIVEEITNLLLSYRRSSLGRGKVKARELEKIEPLFYKEIILSIESRNKEQFKKLIINKLDFFGGLLDSYSIKELPTLNNEQKTFEISIKRKYISNSFLTKDIHYIEKKIAQSKGELNYYYQNNDSFILNFSVNNLTKFSLNSLKKWLLFYFKISHNDRIIVTNKKHKLLPFCNSSLNTKLELDLAKLTKLILSKKIIINNNIDIINFGKSIISNSIELLKLGNKREILNYIYISNLAETYNIDNTYFNYNQLVKQRKSKIEEIKIINEALVETKNKSKIFDAFFNDSLFIFELKKYNTNDLSLLNVKTNDFEETPPVNLIFNIYIKYLFNILNSNDLSLVAYHLKHTYEEI